MHQSSWMALFSQLMCHQLFEIGQTRPSKRIDAYSTYFLKIAKNLKSIS